MRLANVIENDWSKDNQDCSCYMLSQQLNTNEQASCERSAVHHEAVRLKAEIAQRGDELARLERLAGTVSFSRQGTRLHEWPRPSSINCPTTVRSSSTGKIIEQLQREIDQLKLSFQAAQTNYESERSVRETLQLKCGRLEQSIASLRTQSQSYAHTVQRTDKALLSAKTISDTLQSSLAVVAGEKERTEQELANRGDSIAVLQKEVHDSQILQQYTQNQYNVLAKEYRRTEQTYRAELALLRTQVSELKVASRDDLLQTRTAKEDIILCNEAQSKVSEKLKDSMELLAIHRAEQVEAFTKSTDHLTNLIGQSIMRTAHDSDELARLKIQLEAIKDSLRVIKLHPDA